MPKRANTIEAVHRMQKLLTLYPKENLAFNNLAHLFIAMGRYEEADRLFGQALANNFEDVPSHISLYRIALIQNDSRTLSAEAAAVSGNQRSFSCCVFRAKLTRFWEGCGNQESCFGGRSRNSEEQAAGKV